jgi:hypothetical protein
MGVRCVFGHKWTPATDRTEDGALTLVCRRCGKTRVRAGVDRGARHDEEATKAPISNWNP